MRLHQISRPMMGLYMRWAGGQAGGPLCLELAMPKRHQRYWEWPLCADDCRIGIKCNKSSVPPSPAGQLLASSKLLLTWSIIAQKCDADPKTKGMKEGVDEHGHEMHAFMKEWVSTIYIH